MTKPAPGPPPSRITPEAWFDLLLDPLPAGTERIRLDPKPRVAPTYAADADKIRVAEARTGLSEALVTTEGKIGSFPVVCAVLDFRFLGGSMGVTVGQRLAYGLESGAHRCGVVLVTSTGGVRVQEGVAALLQMPRVVAARDLLIEAQRPLIVIVSDPTMGGVAASLVATADVILAEPGARLAFAGPRGADAMGSQVAVDTAEEALEAGLIDQVVARERMRGVLICLMDALVGAL